MASIVHAVNFIGVSIAQSRRFLLRYCRCEMSLYPRPARRMRITEVLRRSSKRTPGLSFCSSGVLARFWQGASKSSANAVDHDQRPRPYLRVDTTKHRRASQVLNMTLAPLRRNPLECVVVGWQQKCGLGRGSARSLGSSPLLLVFLRGRRPFFLVIEMIVD